MISGIIFALVVLFIFWVILTMVFYESRGTVIALYFIFYGMAFAFSSSNVFEAPNFQSAILTMVLPIGVFLVVPIYLVFGIPTLIFLKSIRKGAEGIADIHGRRITEDIPTSSISSGAVGSYVEIKGMLLAFRGYLRNNQYLESGWRLSHLAFLVDDSSGSYALVDPIGAELILDDLNLHLKDEVYVRGYAESGLDYQAKFVMVDWAENVLRMIPNSSAMKKRFDIDQDGVLDDNELKAGAEIMSRELKTKSFPGLMSETKLVFRHTVEHPLIISTKKEMVLTSYLKKRSFGRMMQGVIYMVLTFLVFGGLLSSCQNICKIGPNPSTWHCSYGSKQAK
jgi:hypothetical protein